MSRALSLLTVCAMIFQMNITGVYAADEQLTCMYGTDIGIEQPGGTWTVMNLADLSNKYTKTSALSEGRSETENVVFFTTPSGGWNGKQFVEMDLDYVSNVTGVHLAQLEFQRVESCKIDYFDENDLIWKTAVTNPTLNNVGSSGISTTDITFPTAVKTARLRFYFNSGASDRVRLISLWPVGSALKSEKMNGNLLYGSSVSWNGNERNEGSIDGNFNYDGSSCAFTMQNGKNGELIYTFDTAKTFNTIEITHQYYTQGINKGYIEAYINGGYKKIADIPNKAVFAAMFNYHGAVAKRVVVDLPYAVTAERLKIVVTDATAGSTGTLSVNQCIVRSENTDKLPKQLNSMLTAGASGEVLTFDYVSPFSANVICFDGVKAGTAYIGYMHNGQFVSEKTVTLVEGDNTYIYENPPERNNLAIKVVYSDNTTLASADALRIYGYEPYSLQSQAIKTFETSKKYADYQTAKTLVDAITSSDVKAYYDGLLQTALASVTDSQSMTVSDYSPVSLTAKVSGTAFAADGSDLTVTIADTQNHTITDKVTVNNGAFEKVVSLAGTSEGEISFSIVVFNKTLTDKITTRHAFTGNQITSFAIDGANAAIAGNTITIVLPMGSSFSGRVAVFSISEGAKAYIGTTEIKAVRQR